MPTKKQTGVPEEVTVSSEHQGSGDNPELDQLLSDTAQTDTELAEIRSPSEGPKPDSSDDASAVQTDTETAKKPRRRRKTESEETQSDTEVSPKAASGAKTRRTRAASKPGTKIVAIGEQLTVETEEEKAKNDLLDLIESQRAGRILTGTVQGVEMASATNPTSFAVLYHGEFKVIIPALEMIEPPADYRGRNPEEVHHYMLTKRLGAEVDYIVKGIDPKTGIAAASRLDAMRARRKEYYFGTDRDGNNLIYPDVCAEARVISVIRAGIFIDLFGLEVYIPLRELSYQRWMDAAAHFQPGQRTLVKVLEVDRSDRNNIKVVASVKRAGENPYEKALRKYTVGNRYVGTVSMVDVNGVFVALDGGIDCLCSYPKRGRPPRGSRVTVRILGINHETNRIWGAITHIATPR